LLQDRYESFGEDDVDEESVRVNRCSRYLRTNGCERGYNCECCHEHPKKEDKVRSSKSNRTVTEKRKSDDPRKEVDNTLFQHGDWKRRRGMVQEDVRGFVRLGSPTTPENSANGVHPYYVTSGVHVAVYTYHRELADGTLVEDTVKQTAHHTGVPAENIGIWLNKDCLSQSHFESAPVRGYHAQNTGVLNKIFGTFLERSDAKLLFLVESDCLWEASLTPPVFHWLWYECMKYPYGLVGYRAVNFPPWSAKQSKKGSLLHVC
jgi:hypothetical protein